MNSWNILLSTINYWNINCKYIAINIYVNGGSSWSATNPPTYGVYLFSFVITVYFIISIYPTYLGHLHTLLHHYSIPEISVHFKEHNSYKRDPWHPLSNWHQDVIHHVKQLFSGYQLRHYKLEVNMSSTFCSNSSSYSSIIWSSSLERQEQHSLQPLRIRHQ